MTTNLEMRAAVYEQLLTQVRSDVTVYKTPPDTITAPAIILGGLNYSETSMSAGRTVTMPLYVAVSRKNTALIEALDELVDPGGPIFAVFEDEPPDPLESWVIKSVGDYRDIVIADTNYYAATVNVEVFC